MCVSNAFSIFFEESGMFPLIMLSPFSLKRLDEVCSSDVTNVFYIEIGHFLYRDRNEAGFNHRPL